MSVYTLRTRFKKDIIAEFLPPRKDTGKVIIFCGGMPGVPSSRNLLQFWAKKGYWIFHPRYRGTWESGGRFLSGSPHQDILDVIDQLPKGFTSIWDGRTYKVIPKKLYLFGASFGGPAALLNANDPRVTKVVALSPVIDWKSPSKAEPLDRLGKFVRRAFGEGYRFSDKDWKKLGKGGFYDPMAKIQEISGSKVLMFRAKDDESVHWRPAVTFAKATSAELVMMKKGGHLSSSSLTRPKFLKKILKFLKKK